MKVGELVAYMRVDDSQFNSGMSRGKAALEGLGKLAKTAGQVVATTFTAGTAVAAGLATNLIKTGMAYNSLQQNSRAALSVMLGGAEKANAQMDKLDTWAKNSPFAKQVFIEAQQQLLGFGVAAEDVIPTLDAIQNAVASMGGGSAEIERVTYALAQMKSTGKLSGETLRDLGVMGIDAATIVGEKMGKTGQEIRDMASKPGGIPVDEVWDPLVQGLTDKFGGATDLVKQQWTGATDRIKGAWRDIGATIAKPFIDPNGGGKAVEWANLVADNLRGIEKHVKVAMPVIEKAMGGTFGRVESVLRKSNAAIAGFNLQGAIRQVKDLTKYEPLIAGTGAALFALGLKPIPVIGGLASGIMPLVVGIGALVARDPELRKMGSAFQEGLGGANTTVGALITQVANLAMELIGEVGPGFVAAAGGAGKLVGTGMDLASVLIDVVSAGAPVVGMAADLLGMFLNLPTPVLMTVSAFAAMKAVGIGDILNKIISHGKNLPSATAAMAAYRAGLTPTSAGLVGLGTAMDGAKVKASAFFTAMKGAALSNAPLLAITAIVSVLGAFAQASANAKARADSYADALEGVESAANKAAAAAEVATNAFVSGENADWGWYQKTSTGYETVADALEAVSSSAIAAGDAVAGSQAEFDAYEDSLWAIAETSPELTAVIRELVTKINQQRNSMNDAERAAAQKARTDEEAAAAAEEHAEAMERSRAAADKLRQAEQNLAAAKGDLKLSQYAATDALDAWKESMAEAGEILVDQNGNIDKSTDSWRTFEKGYIDTARAQQQVIDNMIKTGATQEEVDAQVEKSRGVLSGMADEWIGNADAAATYGAEMNLIPDAVSTVVSLETDAAVADADALLAKINDSTGFVTIDASDDPAMARLIEALGAVDDGNGVFTIDAENEEALALLALTLGEVDTSTGILTIDGDDEDAMGRLREAVKKINESDGTVDIFGRDLAEAKRASLVRRLNTSSGTVTIYASDQASSVADSVIRKYSGKYIEMVIGARNSGSIATIQADGGLVEFFANGGRSGPEQHVASYVPAGTWRVFGEDETGGEWYIPRAFSKRARSLQIAAQMVDDFGYQMVPKGASAFADGGSTGTVSASPAPAYSITIGTITIPLDDLAQIQDLADFVDMLKVKMMMQGVG